MIATSKSSIVKSRVALATKVLLSYEKPRGKTKKMSSLNQATDLLRKPNQKLSLMPSAMKTLKSAAHYLPHATATQKNRK